MIQRFCLTPLVRLLLSAGTVAGAIALSPSLAAADPSSTETAPAQTQLPALTDFALPDSTSAEALSAPAVPAVAPAAQPTEAQPVDTLVAQEVIDLNVRRRFQLGYIGAGASFGIAGESALSETGFAVFSKLPLDYNFSVRPGVVFADDVAILLPVTYDFEIQGDGEFLPRALPYVGAGLAISTGDESELDMLLTGGVDIPLSRQLTATAGVNVAPFDSFDIGILVGLAYNFEADYALQQVVDVNPEAVLDDIDRPRVSFLGAGANLGVAGDDDALGDNSFAVFSKIAFTPEISLRPTLLIEDEVTFLVPAALEFDPIQTEYITLVPYLGAGLSFTTGGDSNVDFLVTGGFDIPITSSLAAITGVSITPFDDFDLGIQAGLVFTFGSY